MGAIDLQPLLKNAVGERAARKTVGLWTSPADQVVCRFVGYRGVRNGVRKSKSVNLPRHRLSGLSHEDRLRPGLHG